jgi:hypothetical protein
MNELAPIILFVYNRPWHTQQTLDALAKNDLAKESILYIYADGAKENATETDLQKIEEVRKVISAFEGCKETHIVAREKNYGLANNIIEGITKIIEQYKKIIVLEDDIVTSNYFLTFMNGNLEKYYSDEIIYGIASNAYFENSKLPSTFLLPIGSSWGWATWKDKWAVFEENAQVLINEIKEASLQEKMNFGGYPFFEMLESQNNNLIDSWGIRFYASFFLKKGLFIHPNKSLSYNIGMDNTGTHCDENMPFNNTLSQNFIEYNNLKDSKKAIKYIEQEFAKKFSPTQKQSLISKIKKILYNV